MACLTTHFLEVTTALVSLKVATFVKNLQKVNIFKVIFKGETEKCDQSNYFSYTFEISIPCLTIPFGEATARVSLNVAINVFLTGRKTSKMSIRGYYFKVKMDKCNQSNLCFLMTLEGSHFEQLHIFWKFVHALHQQ